MSRSAIPTDRALTAVRWGTPTLVASTCDHTSAKQLNGVAFPAAFAVPAYVVGQEPHRLRGGSPA
jgi:hypothetical protein